MNQLSGNFGQSFFSSTIKTDTSFVSFFISRNLTKIYRATFKDSLEAEPNIVDIGNPGSVLVDPISIEVIQDGDNWIGLVTGYNSDALYRIDFGSDLLNDSPVITDISASLNLDAPAEVKIVRDSEGFHAFVINNANGTVPFLHLDFGSSIQNDPVESQYTASGSSQLIGIDILQECQDYFGLLTSRSNGKIYSLDFGTSLSNPPTITDITSTLDITLDNPAGIQIAEEGDSLYAFVSSRNGDFYRFDFGNSLLNDPAGINMGNINGFDRDWGLEIIKDKSKWYMVAANFGGRMFVYEFGDHCTANQSTSFETNPLNISYTESGTYYIGLRATATDSLYDWSQKQVIITNDIAPLIDISVGDNSCVENETSFSVTGDTGDIDSYQWIFDEDTLSSSSTAQDTTYQFVSTGSHTIQVVVSSSAGCQNIASAELELYPEPAAPTFTIEEANLCTNTSLTFTNTTDESGFDGLLTYHWDFNGEGTSNQRDTVFTFSEPGSKLITLQSFIPGCYSPINETTIVVDTGPQPDFTWSNNCPGDSIQFTNQSLGDNITGFEWSFGDGNVSTQESPRHLYENDGSYEVEMNVTNASGCTSIIQKAVIVSSGMLVGDSTTTAYINEETYFFGVDSTNTQDSIISWNWSIEGQVLSGQEVTFTFDQIGEYDYGLVVETSQGCTDSLDRTITVLPALCPTPDFSLPTSACIDENFTVINESVNATTYTWDYCNQEELTEIPVVSQFLPEEELGTPFEVEIIQDDQSYFGFVTNRSTNELIRLDFGENLDDEPSVNNLGTLGEVWNDPIDLDIRKMPNGDWLGVAVGFSSEEIYLIDFGDTLINTPSITNITSGVSLSNPVQVKLVDSADYYHAFIINNTNNVVTQLSFDGIVSNQFTSREINISGGNQLSNIDFVKDCDQWSALLVSRGTGSIYKLDFGTSVLNDPTIGLVNIGIPLDNPAGIAIADNYRFPVAFVTSRNGPLYRLDFSEGISADPVSTEMVNLNGFSADWGLSLWNDDSQWIMFGANFNNGVFQYVFPDDCPFEKDGDLINYTTEGVKTVSLEALDDRGNRAYIEKTITITSSIAPDISFTADPSRCIANQNTFTSENTSGNITSYQWIFGEDTLGAVSYPDTTYQFANPGTYLVALDVISDEGCANRFEQEITIYPEPPAPTFLVNGDACTGQELSLDNSTDETGFDDVITYEWFLDGVLISTQVDTTYTFDAPGEYTLGLKSRIPGCESAIVTELLNISQTTTADFSQDTVCIGQSMSFENLSLDATSYSWDFGDGQTSDQFEPMHVYADTGTYQVELTAFDENGGCETMITKDVRVNRTPPQPSFTHSADAYCVDNEIVISNATDDLSFNGEVAYIWTATDHDSVFVRDPVFAFDTPGEKVITLYAQYRTCQSSVYSDTVTIFDLPVTEFNATTVCVGDFTTFTNLSEGESYQWDFGDGFLSTETSPEHLYENPGTYQVALSVTDTNGCVNLLTKEVVVESQPEAQFEYDIVCEDNTATLRDVSIVNGADIVAWEWYLEEELVSQQARPEITFDQSGDQVVRLVVYASNGCESSYSESVSVLSKPEVAFSREIACLGNTSTLIDTSPNQDEILNRTWMVNGAIVATDVPQLDFAFDSAGTYEVTLMIDNENLCSGTVTEDVEILSLPTLDFEVEGSCVNENITLTDLSVNGEDTIVSRSWYLDGLLIGNGPKALVPDVEPGSYTVALTAMTANQCELNYTSSIQVLPKPNVAFTSSNDFGVPPFSLYFTNQTTTGSTYLWYVNDSLVSTEVNPTILFEKAGTQEVKMVATSSQGCSDSTALAIRSVQPVVDVAITDLQLIEANGSQRILLEITNQSNLPVEQLTARVSLENQFEISEQITTRIEDGTKATVSLNLSVPVTSSNLSYLCVSIETLYASADISPENNEDCINIEPKIIFEPAYPNPSRDVAYIRAVLPENGEVTMQFLDISGQVKHELSWTDQPAGLNQWTIDLSAIPSGTYVVLIRYGENIHKSRIVKL